MKRQRRRGIQSDWLLALRQSRAAKTRRRDLPRSVPVNNDVNDDFTPSESLTQFDQVRASDEALRDSCDVSDRTLHIYSPPNHRASNDEIRDPELEQLPEELPLQGNKATVEGEQQDAQHETVFEPFRDEDRRSSDSAPTINQGHQHYSDYQQPCAGPQLNSSDPLCDSRHELDMRNRAADINKLKGMRAIWKNHLTLTAIVAVVGSTRYTVNQYEFTRSILGDEVSSSGKTWPPYSRTQQYFQQILGSCLPDNLLVRLPKKSLTLSNASRRRSGDNILNHHETEEVRIFLPSGWAKLDVATSLVFNDMFPTSYGNDYEEKSLESSRIVQDRPSVTSACDYIYSEHSENSILCGSGSILSISVKNRKPTFPSPYQLSGSNNEYIFSAVITATWCVGANGARNPSFERAITLDSLSPIQQLIMTTFSTAAPRPQESNQAHVGVLPGDICTLLSPESSSEDVAYFAIIVHRFWRFEDGMPSTSILWVHSPLRQTATSINGAGGIETVECHIVARLVLSRLSTPKKQMSRDRGHLADGTPFVVYRILLYCDDFQKSSSNYPNGSAGGCYFLPLSLPPEGRRNTSSVRIISLTPPGVSSNEVLYYIVDDIVHASVCGVEGKTPSGESIKIFIDVVGFVGDYPASAGTVDVIGHIGRAPCTLCSFRRLHESEAEGSRHGYTVDVHAGNSAFLRQAERHLSLRKSSISEVDANILGMVESNRVDNRTSPLIHLCNELQSRQARIPLTSLGLRVVPGYFDPYRSNVIAPDHLLTGLSQDILNTVFECLPTSEMRLQIDAYICSSLRENGLLPQNEAFNMKKKMLHSMTLSELYCVMLVAVPVTKVLTSRFPSTHIGEAVTLLTLLQHLIARTFWWPKRELDGIEAEILVREQPNAYFSELKTLSKSYVKAVDKFCCRTKGLKVYLDKPNLHRLVELYEHSVPAFGHAREFMELVFESAHQPLKRCIARSNNRQAHLFAAEHCVGNDWQGRLAALSRDFSHESSSRRLTARRGLRRLLLGAEADLLDERSDREFIIETDAILHKIFTPALRIPFGKGGMVSNFARAKHTIWTTRGKIHTESLSRFVGISNFTLQNIIRLAKRWINAVYPHETLDEGGLAEPEITLYKMAKRVKVAEEGCRIALQRKGDLVWAICLRCSTKGEYIQTIGKLDHLSFQLVSLTPDIRRIAVYHICEEGEERNRCFSTSENLVKHTYTPLQGARMYFQTRAEGYPPRQG